MSPTSITEIRLKNFKSVTEASVALRFLTVVVGRNSSGKSTLLQAVLALAQAVRNNAVSNRFPLNGELLRLGTFEEVMSFQKEGSSNQIEIGFTISTRPRLQRSSAAKEQAQRMTISWTGHLGEPVEAVGGFVDLLGFEFAVDSVTKGGESTRITLDVSEILREVERDAFSVDNIAFRNGRIGTSILEVQGRFFDFSSGESSRVDSVGISGGLPVSVFRKDTRFNIYARQWWDTHTRVLTEEIAESKRSAAESVSDESQPKPLVAAVKTAAETLVEAYDVEFDRQMLLSEELQLVRRAPGASMAERLMFARAFGLSKTRKARIAESMVRLGQAEFRRRLEESMRSTKRAGGPVPWLDETIYDETDTGSSNDVWQATGATTSFFRDVRYLGPLRESPQVLYDPGPDNADLGTTGKYSAAVLHAQARLNIQAPIPSGGTRRMPLGDAVNLWLAELGLAAAAKATDRGRLGIGLTVSPVGSNRAVDLTSVGVGVSQALPVVLLCLLARPGSIVLLEQPELHLHPAMQQKLADFLLACARSGRQILLETHSEHLVNRLRYRVAADDTAETGSLVRLLFAEQEAGVTTYRQSDVNPLGGLSDDWPRGFLDVGADEAGQLLRQSLMKQRAKIQSAD